MKIARIVLTATILLSLKSTLHCSSSEISETNPSTAVCNLPIYDASNQKNQIRFFGFTINNPEEWTLEHYGQVYLHWGKDHQVAPALTNLETWERFGKNIKNPEIAKSYLQVMEKSGLLHQLSKDSIVHASRVVTIGSIHTQQEESKIQARIEAINELDNIVISKAIEAMRQDQIQKNKDEFTEIKKDSYKKIFAANILLLSREEEDRIIDEKRKQEDRERNEIRHQQNLDIAYCLNLDAQQALQLKEKHNQRFSDAPITEKKFINRIRQIKETNVTNSIPNYVAQYENHQKKLEQRIAAKAAAEVIETIGDDSK
ncbi:MAG: hypothetical protein JO129_03610 [Candidatus Dependentiae bacterium]|nr:hypothetical protein [Candidatus Dependentiae bacterium]